MASKYSAEWWRRFELMSAESMGGGYNRQSEARSKVQQQESSNCATDDSGRPDRCIRDSMKAATAVVAE